MPGTGGETQLTDALHGLDTMEAYHIKGKLYDCGSEGRLYDSKYWICPEV